MEHLPVLKLISLVVLMIGGCQVPPHPRQLTVSAASSLQTILQTLEPQFEQRYPHIDLTFNFAASGVLQRQIEQGAPVDVFFSAAAQPINHLLEQQLLTHTSHRTLLSNQLALIAPQTSQMSLSDFQDLTSPKISKIMVGELASVPVGQYAQEVFSHLNLYPQIQTKLIYAHNVRGVVAGVASAHVDVGIVYATDVRQSDGVKQIALAPAHSHSPIVYPIATVAASAQPQAAQAFIEFLSAAESKQAFIQAGFGWIAQE